MNLIKTHGVTQLEFTFKNMMTTMNTLVNVPVEVEPCNNCMLFLTWVARVSAVCIAVIGNSLLIDLIVANYWTFTTVAKYSTDCRGTCTHSNNNNIYTYTQ